MDIINIDSGCVPKKYFQYMENTIGLYEITPKNEIELAEKIKKEYFYEKDKK
jgi:hypothetical protein